MTFQRRRLLPYLMWFLPLSFFTYQFILRLWPSLLMQEIMAQFAIDASAFGFLSAMYYYGYAGMQIPIAIALDRLGARIVVSFCIIICALATLMFTFTENWLLALLGRFLVGVGSAVGFLGTSKVISEWFPNNKYARMVGFSFTFGLMGALYGGKPTSILVEYLGWQQVAIVLAVLAFIIGLFVILFLRAPKKILGQEEDKLTLADLKEVLKSPSIWWLALANLLMVGALEGFADVWGVNFLMEALKLNKSDAAGITSFIFVGMLFGGPVLATLCIRISSYNVIAGCGFGMATLFYVLIFAYPYFNSFTLCAFFFLIGIMCCYQVIIFAVGTELVSIRLLGVTIAFLNSINMLGGSFFHTLIGKLMDLFWTGYYLENGSKLYTLASYTYAIQAIPLCSLVGGLIVFSMARRRFKLAVR